MAQYDDDTIRQVSSRCLDLFIQNIENAKSLDQAEQSTQGTIQDEFVRFKLWESNIRVFADVHASLDFRLREVPDVAELFLRQLDTIEERLDQVLHIAPYFHGSPHQCSECGRVFTLLSETQSHLQAEHSIYDTGGHKSREHEFDAAESFHSWSRPELLQSIHESIDWLHRLSNMVRKASFNHQNKRADHFMLRDESGEKSAELTHSMLEGLTQLYQFYVRTHATGLGEHLAQRLVQTMIIRHKRILYRRARRKVWNLQQITYSPPKIEYNPRIPLSAPETTTPSDALGKSPLLPVSTADMEMAGSQVTATTVDISMIRKAFARSEVSKATSHSLIVSDRVLVPPRPAAGKSGTDFVCDYCGLLLEARQASNAAVWAKHVRKDLDPYVCVFDDCNTPFEIYSSSREWLSHMRSQHRMRWHCFATSHGPTFFESPEVLEEHLRDIHAGHFSSEEISFLVENSHHPSLSVIEHCPFCEHTAENTEEHVARHLIQFALRSLPWPEDCYSSYHPSQSSRSARSEGTASSAETSRDDAEMRELRETDWDAWQSEIEAEDNRSRSFKSRWHDEPPLTGEKRDVVGLDDFISPNYDAAEDEVLEPFRQRANIDAVKRQPAEIQRSRRQKSLRNFIKEEATFVQDLHVLTEIFKGTSEACPQLDERTVDRLFRNLDQVAALHVEFLTDLNAAASSTLKEPQLSISRDKPVSSSPTAPELIGAVFLENFRRLGPAHEVYSSTHEEAISLLQSIQDEPTVRVWIKECNEVSSDLTTRKFDELLELSNRRYRSEYYATWMNRLFTQTPDNHSDKESLLAAIAWHRDSVSRAESIKKRKEIVQRVLANGNSGGSLLSRVFKSQDSTDDNPLDDADFTELCERFHDDHLRLQVTVQDSEHYCRQVNAYCHRFSRLFSFIDLFMRLQPGSYPEIESKWVQFYESLYQWLKEDLKPESYVSRISEHIIEPINKLISMRSRAMLLMSHRKDRRQDFEKRKALERNGKKPGKQLARISEEFEAIDSVLRHELPILHDLVMKLMARLLSQLIVAQSQWYLKWQKMFQRLIGRATIPRLADIMADFHDDFMTAEEDFEELEITGSSQSRRRRLATPGMRRTLLQPEETPDLRSRYAARQEDDDPGSSSGSDESLKVFSPTLRESEDDPGPSKSTYNSLWLAASLFEFNIETTKREAGYPYLTYQAGEIFDVIAEKGELWLAVNTDDPNGVVGWIWSKHFANLGLGEKPAK